jgi:hypothetical protein
MTTVAGPIQNGPQQADEHPRNRAADALENGAGGWVPLGDPESHSELDRDLAAYQLAVDITELAGFLTVRERMVLAAALLPEFQITDQP